MSQIDTEWDGGPALHPSAGTERRHAAHPASTRGLVRWLRERGYVRQAEVFAELDSMRIGRWYGKQGNGSAAQRMAELLREIAAWSVAGASDR